MKAGRAVALALLLCAPAARAYNETIHAFLTVRAFALRESWLAEELPAPAAEEIDALRAIFYREAAAGSASFRARFPSVDRFDAWEMKRYFMLNPKAQVHGFDPVDLRPMKRGELLAIASRWPDDDERNRYRFRYSADREVVHASDGSILPEDPATLDFGGLTGTTSQGHAHYGLVEGPLSDDPEVLKKDPRRFAIPKTAHAYGAELAQLYTDLALLAGASDLPGRDWLATCFAGAAFHHIEDVGNQIHTVQVGFYDFFRDAFLQSKLRDLVTLGGVFGPRRSLKQIGVRLVANHHLFSEDLFAKRVAEAISGAPGSAEVRDAIAGLDRDDPGLVVEAERRLARSPDSFGGDLAQSVIELSSPEGAEVYRLAYTLSARTLRQGGGHEYDGSKGDDPDAYLAPPSPERDRALARFYALEGRGLRRAATALRLWERQFEAALRARPAEIRTGAVARTVSFLDRYQTEAATRRASYQPEKETASAISWGYPIAAVALVCSAVVLFARKRRRGNIS
jgi:hypothetical protein